MYNYAIYTFICVYFINNEYFLNILNIKNNSAIICLYLLRRIKMNRAEFIFKYIDKIMHRAQNSMHFDNITVNLDNVYDERYEDCKADFYYRDKNILKPVLIYTHGGGFVKGGKKHRASLSEFFADKGYFVFNADYRLSPKYSFPAPIEDVFNMAKYLESIKDEYNLDLNKIVIAGDSSGGYVAAQFLAALYNKDMREELNLPDCDIKISAYVGICSVYDFIKMMRSPVVPFGIGRVTGNSFLGIKLKRNYSNLEDFCYKKYISPIDYINKDWCPCMILYSQKDLFCYKQAEEMIKKLEESNVPYSWHYSKNIFQNHCYQLILKNKSSQIAMQKTIDFLNSI